MMRRVLVFLVLGSILWASDAKEAARNLGVQSHFKTAFAQAKAQKKMLVMVLVKKHCRWCEKMVTRTLADKKVLQRLKQDYVTLIIDKDDTYPNIFKEDLFPSVHFIDPGTGKSVYEDVGYTNVEHFMDDLDQAQKIRKDIYN